MKKTIIKADSQILNSINLCGMRYKYEHVMNRRPIEKPEAFSKGDMIHRMLAHYYRAKRDGVYAGRESVVISECIEIGTACAAEFHLDSKEVIEVCIPTFKAYILKYQYDGWEVEFVEEPFTTILYDSEDLKILHEGIIDLGITDVKGERAIVDHKTESRKSHPFLLSNQFQGYAFAFKRKVIINKVGFQTSLSDEERFRRYHYVYSDAILSEWVEDAVQAYRTAIEWHRADHFPRNRTSCDKYYGCIYQRVCKEEPEVRSHKLQVYYSLEPVWDPYTRDVE